MTINRSAVAFSHQLGRDDVTIVRSDPSREFVQANVPSSGSPLAYCFHQFVDPTVLVVVKDVHLVGIRYPEPLFELVKLYYAATDVCLYDEARQSVSEAAFVQDIEQQLFLRSATQRLALLFLSLQGVEDR